MGQVSTKGNRAGRASRIQARDLAQVHISQAHFHLSATILLTRELQSSSFAVDDARGERLLA